MSKHIKLRREAKPSRPPEKYGETIWWSKLPTGAINHSDLVDFFRGSIKDKNFRKRLHCVTHTGSIFTYEFTLHVVEFLVRNHFNLIFFENYWFAHAFSMQQKASRLGNLPK